MVSVDNIADNACPWNEVSEKERHICGVGQLRNAQTAFTPTIGTYWWCDVCIQTQPSSERQTNIRLVIQHQSLHFGVFNRTLLPPATHGIAPVFPENRIVRITLTPCLASWQWATQNIYMPRQPWTTRRVPETKHAIYVYLSILNWSKRQVTSRQVFSVDAMSREFRMSRSLIYHANENCIWTLNKYKGFVDICLDTEHDMKQTLHIACHAIYHA